MSKVFYTLESVNNILKKENPSNVCIVTSKLLKTKLSWAIKKINFKNIRFVIIPDGESAKEWDILEKIILGFTKNNLDRNSIVIALGGGSVGDIVGFASAIYLRGVRYIQIPTTLLSQVDSAHGGKTGINFFNYKNQIGVFNLPMAIIIDERFIKTLNPDQIVDGLGEIIKAGYIKDSTILEMLDKETVSTLQNSKKLGKIIKKSINVKNHFIKEDYKDIGVRQILNVGHTIGHSIELKYKISHGLAVLIGTRLELKMSEILGVTSPDVLKSFDTLLDKLGIEIDDHYIVDKTKILHDKKISGQKIIWPVITKKGQAQLINIEIKKFLLLASKLEKKAKKG